MPVEPLPPPPLEGICKTASPRNLKGLGCTSDQLSKASGFNPWVCLPGQCEAAGAVLSPSLHHGAEDRVVPRSQLSCCCRKEHGSATGSFLACSPCPVRSDTATCGEWPGNNGAGREQRRNGQAGSWELACVQLGLPVGLWLPAPPCLLGKAVGAQPGLSWELSSVLGSVLVLTLPSEHYGQSYPNACVTNALF